MRVLAFMKWGEGIDHKAFLSAIRNLIGRKAGKFQRVYHPLSSLPPRPPMRNKHLRWEDTHDYIPDDFNPLAVQRFWDACMG